MIWSDIWILYKRELRSALRERSIVINSLLVPLVMYPLMAWMIFSGFMFVQGYNSRENLRVALLDLPEFHTEIRDELSDLGRIDLIDGITTPAEAQAAIRSGQLEAAVTFLPAGSPDATLPQNVRVDVVYDAASDRSRDAYNSITDVVDDYRDGWLEREALSRGVSAEELMQFRISRVDVSTESELGAMLLGLMLPIMLTIMVALGCLYPAIDSTAGERERSTWETLMTVAPARTSVVAAKYLYVATIGVLSGILNVLGISLAMGFLLAPLLAGIGEEFALELPLMAVGVMMAGAVVLALFFSAAMMILASFARTFKDGQAMAMPVYYLALLPIVIGQSPDRRLDLTTALIPIANVAQMVKDAILGVFSWGLIAISLAEALLLVGACVWLAARILSFEDHLMGSFEGSFWKFARERLFSRSRPESAGGRS